MVSCLEGKCFVVKYFEFDPSKAHQHVHEYPILTLLSNHEMRINSELSYNKLCRTVKTSSAPI